MEYLNRLVIIKILNGAVAQRQQAADLKSVQCGFESRSPYQTEPYSNLLKDIENVYKQFANFTLFYFIIKT